VKRPELAVTVKGQHHFFSFTCMKKTSAPDKRSNQLLVSCAMACSLSADAADSDSTHRATHCIVKCTSLLCAIAHDSYMDMVYCWCIYIRRSLYHTIVD
jgi:hypothetical protein